MRQNKLYSSFSDCWTELQQLAEKLQELDAKETYSHGPRAFLPQIGGWIKWKAANGSACGRLSKEEAEYLLYCLESCAEACFL